MVPPPLGAPDGSMLPDWSVDNELAARMDNFGVVPEAGAAPRATSGRTSRTHPRGRTNRELLNLEAASANPHPSEETSDSEFRDSGITPAPSGLTPEPSHSTSSPPPGPPTVPPPGPSSPAPGPPPSPPGPSGSPSSTKEILKTIGIVALAGIGVGALAVVAAPVVLAAAGFTSSGVAAGSMAAAYQATLGGVIAKGSVFAALQSFGAAGLPAMAQATTAVAGAGVGGSLAAAWIPVKIVCATLRSARTADTATFIVEAVGAVSSAVYRALSSSRELAQGNPTR
ncbi:hypothetical protein HPB50_013076 [Hyalomma asiaticum]|uniref:Uncharacterized protein n=1 Tax=Hyalomma asiaticum TaxID=266040 RepID=A0ACB7RPN3_HYAAI|nr:hypothetical protein HPB50_013076 [Hyalomma asiaticum]